MLYLYKKHHMKYLLPALFCIVLLPAAYAQKTTANVEMMHSLFNAINQHDSIAVAGFFADSAKLESPNWEGTQTGKQAVTTIYSRYFKGTPDIKYDITNIIATDDAVVVEYTFGGKFSNPEASSPAYMLNKIYSLKGSTRFNISNNKITTSVSYFDQVAFLRQVGFFDQH